jgi:hypothetical protein
MRTIAVVGYKPPEREGKRAMAATATDEKLAADLAAFRNEVARDSAAFRSEIARDSAAFRAEVAREFHSLAEFRGEPPIRPSATFPHQERRQAFRGLERARE